MPHDWEQAAGGDRDDSGSLVKNWACSKCESKVIARQRPNPNIILAASERGPDGLRKGRTCEELVVADVHDS